MKQLAPLYGRKPMGVGTPLIESLSGFFGRLAVARDLMPSTICNELVRPLVPEGIRGNTYWRGGLCGQNGLVWDDYSDFTEALSGALTELTALDGLVLHTLLPWRRVLSPERGYVLRRRHRRWCASCVAGWRKGGVEPWEPLIWRVELARRCPVHRTLFSETCPECGSSQGFPPGLVSFGMCRSCGHYLEIGDPLCTSGIGLLARPEDWWEWRVSWLVGRMLAAQEEMAAFANPRGFLTLLDRVRRRRGIRSTRNLSVHLGVDYVSLQMWLKGRRLWRFESFLRVCSEVGADPLAVAVFPHREFSVSGETGGGVWCGAQLPARQSISKHSLCRSWDAARWKRMEEELSEFLVGPERGRRSMTVVAKLLGISPGTLKKRYPKEYARLVSLREGYVKRRRGQRLTLQEKTLRKAFERCVRQGLRPRQDLVFKFAGLSPLYGMNHEYRPIWRKLRREYDEGEW